jgi:hypothetical protein
MIAVPEDRMMNLERSRSQVASSLPVIRVAQKVGKEENSA